MKQDEKYPRVEIAFNIWRDIPTLTRIASIRWDYSSNQVEKKEEDNKINDLISLLMKKEPKGKKNPFCWTCK